MTLEDEEETMATLRYCCSPVPSLESPVEILASWDSVEMVLARSQSWWNMKEEAVAIMTPTIMTVAAASPATTFLAGTCTVHFSGLSLLIKGPVLSANNGALMWFFCYPTLSEATFCTRKSFQTIIKDHFTESTLHRPSFKVMKAPQMIIFRTTFTFSQGGIYIIGSARQVQYHGSAMKSSTLTF